MKKVFLAAFAALSFVACNNATTDHTTAANDTTKMNNTNNSEEANEQRNKETALASERAFDNTNAINVVFKDADRNFVEYGDGSGRPIKSVDSVKAFLKDWLTAIPNYRGSDFTAVAEGNKVMVYGTWKGTWKNDLMGQKATAKSFTVKDVDYFTFNADGKMIEHRNVVPMSEIAQQIGLKMPTPKS